jgi:ubiquinone/menaquinone biosynthesis C-methylase UbiE
MHTELIQRQYNDIIAPHYDEDPQSVTSDTLDRAVAQLRRRQPAGANGMPFKVFDVGMGTGLFLAKLKAAMGCSIEPFGLDLSAKMIEVARTKIRDLTAVVDNADNLDAHFLHESFDLIATHFITGFVPATVLAPKIWDRLAEGGCWSLIGGTKQGFPALQTKANSRFLRWMLGGKELDVDHMVCNPADRAELVQTLERHGFVIRECETFRPEIRFANLNEFLDFAYYGGWLTPFVEALGLHEARAMVRLVLNTFVFPINDHHCIEVVLAQKGERR